jgi:hypothetical protein
VNNLAYAEALGGESSFDAYRADLRGFWRHRGGHVLAFRQYNWLTYDAPSAAQATVVLRGYKFGEYLAPYMSSLEAEERLSFSRRWGVGRRGKPRGFSSSATVGDPRLAHAASPRPPNRRWYAGRSPTPVPGPSPRGTRTDRAA